MGPWDAEERRQKPPKVLPLASREGSDHELFNVINGEAISIHASRGGSDSTVKLSPDDRTKQYGFREPGFSGFLSAVSTLFFFWALGVRAYRIMVSLGSYPFFVPI